MGWLRQLGQWDAVGAQTTGFIQFPQLMVQEVQTSLSLL